MIQSEQSSVFDAITHDPARVAQLQFRSDLMAIIHCLIGDKEWTTDDLMARLDVPAARVSELRRGKYEKFSADKLIGYLFKLGYQFRPTATVEGTGLKVSCAVHAQS